MDKVVVGNRYLIVRSVDGKRTRSFYARINWVEDRGDYYYIGYTPDDSRICRWGCCRVMKQNNERKVCYTLEEAPSEAIRAVATAVSAVG